MHWGMHVSTRASALALALVAVAVLGGPASATAYQFYDGASDPPPNSPQVQLSPGAVYWVVLENSAASGGTGWSWWNTRNDTYIAPGVGEQSNSMGAKWGLAKGDFELRTFGYAEVGVVLAMTADRLGVRAGDTLTYTLWLNNSGTAPAGVVWINDTLPAYVAYAWDNATDLGGVKVGDANCTFPGLLPGPHAFVLRVSVQRAAAPGAILTNVARLNYTDAAGASRPGSAVAITSIVIAVGDAPFNLWIPFALGLLFGIPVLVALVARPKGRVEEVFLVSQGGTLISHFSRTLKPHGDRDILAAMLTAVQSFIRDSFDPKAARKNVLPFRPERYEAELFGYVDAVTGKESRRAA